jgi:hypothetical protein
MGGELARAERNGPIFPEMVSASSRNQTCKKLYITLCRNIIIQNKKLNVLDVAIFY